MHQDHYKGIAELCREGMVEKLFIYEGNRSEEKGDSEGDRDQERKYSLFEKRRSNQTGRRYIG